MFPDVRKLERLDTWRCAQELAYRAYLLTLSPQLSRHFALIDQIRRAGLSVPANIEVRTVIDLCDRVIAMIIGLIRKLMRR